MILDFLIGEQPDIYNRYLEDIWKMSDEDIESVHNFIQWTFPLNERSGAVPNSPILTQQEIIDIKQSEIAKQNVKKSADWFLNFLTRNSYWICQSNHNHFRITRAIKSLHLIHSNEEAENFKNSVLNLIKGNENKINPISLEFWKNS
ncbi:opioid growth factor receptor-related protein [Candidatus Pelagibacter communis]|uniref:opioid growth factor receptor-related protein n=1 Tax=Pelagibacter ubique TaxID=198252 RepID=UPI00094DC0F2|nr:opioid growth factor receptor-related protein [Candidatus Pelagibacter ubique]